MSQDIIFDSDVGNGEYFFRKDLLQLRVSADPQGTRCKMREREREKRSGGRKTNRYAGQTGTYKGLTGRGGYCPAPEVQLNLNLSQFEMTLRISSQTGNVDSKNVALGGSHCPN